MNINRIDETTRPAYMLTKKRSYTRAAAGGLAINLLLVGSLIYLSMLLAPQLRSQAAANPSTKSLSSHHVPSDQFPN